MDKLSATWRPLMMYVFILIIFNNYLVYPYLSNWMTLGAQPAIPDVVWDIIKIAVGIYIFGRSAEKTATNWRQGGQSGNQT